MAKHASLRESHATAMMSAAIFGFTLITIVFTPLSFFASLFSLPIDRLQVHQTGGLFSDQSGMYSARYVGTYMGKSSFESVTFHIDMKQRPEDSSPSQSLS